MLATQRERSLADCAVGKTDSPLAEWVLLYKELWIKRAEKPPAAHTMRNAVANLKKIASADYAWRKLRDIETVHIAPHISLVTTESGSAAALAMRVRLPDVFRMAETKGHIQVGRNPVAATYTPERTVKRERLTLERFLKLRDLAPFWLRHAMNLALFTGQRR